MAKETEKKSGRISSRVAFVLRRMVEDPERFLQADKERGGLTTIGQINFTQTLQREMEPCLKVIADDPQITKLAHLYEEEIKEDMAGGTVAIHLNSREREEFDEYLQGIDNSPDSLLRNLVSTRLTF
jgi:hypothetical protein